MGDDKAATSIHNKLRESLLAKYANTFMPEVDRQTYAKSKYLKGER